MIKRFHVFLMYHVDDIGDNGVFNVQLQGIEICLCMYIIYKQFRVSGVIVDK